MTQQTWVSPASTGPSARARLWRNRWTVPAVLLSLMLVALTGRLALTAWQGGSIAGCGPGSGCGAVTSSAWSRWLSVPVSALAAGLYLAVLVALVVQETTTRQTLRRHGQTVLAAACVAIIGAAGWFGYLMLARLEQTCIYCLAAHGMGLILCGLVIGVLYRSPRGSTSAPTKLAGFAPAAALGLLSLVILIGGQIARPTQSFTVTHAHDPDHMESPAGMASAFPAPGDAPLQPYDSGPGPDRLLHLPRTHAELRVSDFPRVGPIDAKNIIVAFGDYACPHCHELTDQMIKAVDRYPGQLAMVRVMVPMNAECNPILQEVGWSGGERYASSCDLAKLAIALFRIDAAAFDQFERWASSAPTTPSLPDAAKEAMTLIDRERLIQELDGPDVGRALSEHVAIFRSLPPNDSGQSHLPVVVMDGSYVRGTPKTASELFAVLEKELGLQP